jgi:hypothetical protein
MGSGVKVRADALQEVKPGTRRAGHDLPFRVKSFQALATLIVTDERLSFFFSLPFQLGSSC